MRVHLPSARNLEIYHQLEDDGASIRDVADEFRLSPNRIVQIRGQVHRWYQCCAPDAETDQFRRQDAVASCKRHKIRAGRMFSTMMDAFRDSQGEEKLTRDSRSGGAVTITRMSHGDPKYLTVALRYSREQLNAALTLAELPDEYFVPVAVEVVEPTAAELAIEAEEDRERLDEEAAYRRRAMEYVEKMAGNANDDDGDREEEDDAASVSPARVCTAATSAAAVTSADSSTTSGATPSADAASEVAEILREQHRREAKQKATPVHSASNVDQRRALARALAG
jgi:hypothetical protein